MLSSKSQMELIGRKVVEKATQLWKKNTLKRHSNGVYSLNAMQCPLIWERVILKKLRETNFRAHESYM